MTTTGVTRPVGEIYLTREEIARRVGELGEELATAYAGRQPLLVAPLKSSVVFLADLSRALPIAHQLDFLELAAYTGAGSGSGVRLLKDLDASVVGRHALIVEDVVDTGMTLNFLARTLRLRQPASIAAVTLLDRPYRRLVDDVPLEYVGFTVPDELFAGYGLGLEECWRALPDLHFVAGEALPESLTGDGFRRAEPGAAAA
jgi:hypoxanthine phosphoribosyltransferase